VLLGNPGAGKSTFAQKLCFDLAAKSLDRVFAFRQVTPVLVVLREYGAEKKAHNCSIVQFIQIRSLPGIAAHAENSIAKIALKKIVVFIIVPSIISIYHPARH
jgi:hypothetical protein